MNTTGCGPHILLVDDDAYMCALNAGILMGSGYKVQTAAHGAEAWKALELRNYDLLITENIMPYVTGMQLLKHLRSRGPYHAGHHGVPERRRRRS